MGNLEKRVTERKGRRLPCSVPLSEQEIAAVDQAAYETRSRSRAEYMRRVVLRDAERVKARAEKGAA